MIDLTKPFKVDDFPLLKDINNDLYLFNNEQDGYSDIGWFKEDLIFYMNCLRERYLKTEKEDYYKLLILLLKGVKG